MKKIFKNNNNWNSTKLIFQKVPLLLLAALWVTGCTNEQEKDNRPNVLFILADDLGFMDTSVYGSKFYETPNIDRLAQRGILFSNAYSTSPLCSPTRASLLTGLHPSKLRLTTAAGHLPEEILDPVIPQRSSPNRRVIEPESRTRLLDRFVTYADVLSKSGYQTAFLGKWHLGPPPYSPEENGFEFVVGGREHPGPPPPGNYFAPWNVKGLSDYESGTHIADALVEETISFIDDLEQKPFLINLWYYDVHAPFQSVSELTEKYRNKLDALPADYPQRSPEMAAMIEKFDSSIGRVLAHLEKRGLTENTLVIFTSDNGGNMYDRISGEFPTHNAPLRGGKGINYEGGTRVPLILSWPGSLEEGISNSSATSSIDIFPTILDIAGFSQELASIPGTSLLELIDGESDPRELYFDFPHYVDATGNIPNSSVIAADWKLYKFYGDSDDGDDRFELYHLPDDLGEALNLASKYPEKVAAMNNLIEAHNERTLALIPAKNPDYSKLLPTLWRTDGATLEIRSDELELSSINNDPMLITRTPFTNRAEIYLTFTMKSESSGRGQVFWTSQNHPAFSEASSKLFDVKHDNQWHEYKIKIKHSEALGLLRIDPSQSTGKIFIKDLSIDE